MADILEEFDFSLYTCSVGRNEKYPWSEWMDGQIWKLKQGVDFKTKTSSFAAGIRARARKNGIQLKTAMFGEYVVFQAVSIREDKGE